MELVSSKVANSAGLTPGLYVAAVLSCCFFEIALVLRRVSVTFATFFSIAFVITLFGALLFLA